MSVPNAVDFMHTIFFMVIFAVNYANKSKNCIETVH
jgi:hypothetical protein